MPERFEPGKKSENPIKEKPYGTLRGFILKSSAVLGVGGLLALGYGINQVRLEENSENREKARVTREFYKTNPDPNPGQLFELQEEVDSINKKNKSVAILTAGGGTIMTLGLNGVLFAGLFMSDESRPTNRKKRDDQPLTGTQ